MKLLPSKELEKNLNPYRCLQSCCKNAALHLAGEDFGGGGLLAGCCSQDPPWLAEGVICRVMYFVLNLFGF